MLLLNFPLYLDEQTFLQVAGAQSCGIEVLDNFQCLSSSSVLALMPE